MTDNEYVSSLLRKRSYLRATADRAKVQEVDEQLRLAGVDVAELDKEPKAEVPERKSPVEKHVTAESGAKRPGRPKKAEL